MAATDNGDWHDELREDPRLLTGVLWVKRGSLGGYLELSMGGAVRGTLELPPSKVVTLMILHDAPAEHRKESPDLPDALCGHLEYEEVAARYRRQRIIIFGITKSTISSYLMLTQKEIREALGIPHKPKFPDLLFVRESRRRQVKGVRIRPGALEIRWLGEEGEAGTSR
jgi:hypothetical protein